MFPSMNNRVKWLWFLILKQRWNSSQRSGWCWLSQHLVSVPSSTLITPNDCFMHLSFLCVLNELIESQGSREVEHVHGRDKNTSQNLYLQSLFENSLSTPLTHNFSLISPSACFSKYREVQLLWAQPGEKHQSDSLKQQCNGGKIQA